MLFPVFHVPHYELIIIYMNRFFVIIMTIPFFLNAQTATAPQQAEEGPGGKGNYQHDEVLFQDFAGQPEGYWLFEPAASKPDTAPVVVFLHGYGALNPMIYGRWIRHIVRQGNTVIFPRYQKNLLSPSPKKFVQNVAQGIRDALEELKKGDHVQIADAPLVVVGHSYGGTIAANLAVHFDSLQIPQPKGVLLCAPGTGPFSGGKLKNYKSMPADTKLLIMVNTNDHVVGDDLGKLIFETAQKTPERNLLIQDSDYYGSPAISSGHNEAYCLDMEYDTGLRNMTCNRALSVAKENAVDYYGYWKLLDALMEYTRNGKYKEYAFGNTPEQTFLGNWSDGTPIKPLKVLLPETVAAAVK